MLVTTQQCGVNQGSPTGGGNNPPNPPGPANPGSGHINFWHCGWTSPSQSINQYCLTNIDTAMTLKVKFVGGGGRFPFAPGDTSIFHSLKDTLSAHVCNYAYTAGRPCKPGVSGYLGTYTATAPPPGTPFYHFSLKMIEDMTMTVDEFGYTLYPNPASGQANLHLELPQDEVLSIAIYDMVGSKVKSVSNKEMAAGSANEILQLNGLQSGTYIVIMQVGEQVYQEKLVVMD